MLLRLHVRGFKNLEDVSVRFGPLTCFVGPNGVGKSNVFDALHFLKLLSVYDIQEAAARVRRPSQGTYNPIDLLFGGDPGGRIRLEADLLVPKEVKDDFARPSEPSTTLLRYAVQFRFAASPAPRLELEEETLTHHKQRDARELFGFSASPEFRKSVVHGVRRGGALISTDDEKIQLHQDGGSRGQPFPPGRSPRTVVGGTNTYEYPTVLAARREMASWRFVQLEPSAMRSPDLVGTLPEVTEHGAGIAATLNDLAQAPAAERSPLREVVNDLKALNADIEDLRVDRDDARDQLVVAARSKGIARWLGPRSLSDGTLRYLALVTMKHGRSTPGLVCMEEPENGMHPTRVPALVDLLRGLAVDPNFAVDPLDNPLRQVVLNTHSPDVVRRLERDEVLFVTSVSQAGVPRARVAAVDGGWRGPEGSVPVDAIADFIGGAPVASQWAQQLPLRFGSAR